MNSKNRPPTIADVAQKAQVSIATVSRVLNGTTPVHLEKANRVRLAMEELQFVPRHAARVLASKRTNTIGLLISEISGAFIPPMLKGIEASAFCTILRLICLISLKSQLKIKMALRCSSIT